ncbi:MAG TPA: adenylate/guanylate cyclase domain-containing protein [Bryobacteraceae bacterium]|jgi:class 3 adenylate cyclase
MNETRQVAILFTDMAHFSKLGEGHVRPFVSQVMGAFAAIIHDHKPMVSNTWGDALFLVFATPEVGANCALALRDKVRNTNWAQHGLPTNLGMRFSLHNASAEILNDPVTKRPNAYGIAVNQTARLEPVVIPNEVFATQEFITALNAKGPTSLYAFDRVGELTLAKGFGVSIVYRIRRPNEIALEEPELGKLLAGQLNQKSVMESLLSNTLSLIDRVGSVPVNLATLLKYVDTDVVNRGVFRDNWKIHLRYDIGKLAVDGIIEEHIEWSYYLVNVSSQRVKHRVALITAPELEGKGGFISFHKIEDDGTEHAILPPTTLIRPNTASFAAREQDIELAEQSRYRLEMRYMQQWPVSKTAPTVHNSISCRESSFDIRLEIDAPHSTEVGVLFGDYGLEPKYRDGNRSVFNVPSLMLRNQVIELLLKFPGVLGT